jgi:hypothetical protein
MKLEKSLCFTSPERQRRVSASTTPHFRPWGSWLIFLLLCGHLIFCHGCHGEDVDDELCVPPPLREMQNSKSEIRRKPQTRMIKPLTFWLSVF